MPLTPEEQQELNSINSQIAEAEKSYVQGYQPTAADIAYAKEKTGVGEEGFFESGLIGAGRAGVNVGRGLGQLVGAGPTQEEVDEERRLFGKIGSPTGAMLGEITGDIATFAIPGVGAAKGLSHLGRASSTVGRLTNSASKLMPKAKLARYTLGGTLGGATGGLVTPMGTGETKAGQVITGAALGTLLGAPLGYGIEKALIPGARKLTRALTGRGKPKVTTPSRVMKQHMEGAEVSKADLKKTLAVVDDFKANGLEHITPPVKSILNNNVVDNRLNRLVTSEKAEDMIALKNVRVEQEVDNITNEMRQVMKLESSMPNSKLLEVVPKAAGFILARAKKVAQQASNEFYEAAGRVKLDLDQIPRAQEFLKSPVIKNSIKKLKSDPEYKQLTEEIEASILRIEPDDIKQARALVNDSKGEFDKAYATPQGNRTSKQNEFVNDYIDAKSVVDQQNGFTSLSYLDLVSRAMRARSDKLRAKVIKGEGDATKLSVLDKTQSDFNQFLKDVSPELKQAKDAYSKNIEWYMDLQKKGMGTLAGMKKGNIVKTIKSMNKADADDFATIVKEMNKQQPGMGDELAALWLVDELEDKVKTDATSLQNITNFFSRKGNIKKINTVVQDPEAKKLFKKLELISKYYKRPTAKGTGGGAAQLPIADLPTRKIAGNSLNVFKNIINERKLKYLFDSNKWPEDVARMLAPQKNKTQNLQKTSEALNTLLNVSIGREDDDNR